MPLMDVVSPPLTAARIEHREMGRTAAKMLVAAARAIIDPLTANFDRQPVTEPI